MKVPASHTLVTERLLIKQAAEEDLPHVFEATRYEGFNEGMTWDPPAKIEDMLPHLHDAHKAWAEGRGYGFSIWVIDASEFVGRVSIRRNDWGEGWNVGYFMHPMHQGKGYMTEAVQAILKFGFDVLNAPTIEAYYATWNKASGRVLEKVGMKLRSYVRYGFKKKGQWVPEFRVVITRQDWGGK